jgi:hypothetical protein
MPVVEIVPVSDVPPAIPLTTQATVVSETPVTVALKVCEVPRRREALLGVTVTVVEDGTGGGTGGGAVGGTGGFVAPELTPLTVLPAQPSMQPAKTRRNSAGTRTSVHDRK